MYCNGRCLLGTEFDNGFVKVPFEVWVKKYGKWRLTKFLIPFDVEFFNEYRSEIELTAEDVEGKKMPIYLNVDKGIIGIKSGYFFFDSGKRVKHG